jgi:hypothetical protein
MEGGPYMVAHGLIQRLDLGPKRSARWLLFEIERGRSHQGSFGQQRCPLDRVAQLPDVARPAVSE